MNKQMVDGMARGVEQKQLMTSLKRDTHTDARSFSETSCTAYLLNSDTF